MAKQPKQPVTPPPDEPKASAIALRALVKVVTALDEHVTVEAAGLREFSNPDKAAALALLGQKLGQIMGEARKLEAEDRAQAGKMSPQAVAAYLRALNKAEWSHLRREVDEHFSGGSVLA